MCMKKQSYIGNSIMNTTCIAYFYNLLAYLFLVKIELAKKDEAENDETKSEIIIKEEKNQLKV